MTVTSNETEVAPGAGAAAIETVNIVLDGIQMTVPKDTLIIRAAEMVGIEIPRFCDHPLLDPVGACRQCLVDVEGQRKPLASCTTTVTDGMVVHTQHSSEAAEKAQRGVLELLLVNHPLDCPVCDKGGECPLQNQAMSHGQADSRFTDVKRTFPKPLPISSQVLLDRERCVLCARCTRFSKQIAGDPFIDLIERGALQQVGIYEAHPFESYFSGNTVQICPVGALTGASYRFRARPFDLVSTAGVCEHCSVGCAIRSDHRRGKVLRRMAAEDAQVNEEWNCDKGRWAFTYTTDPARLRSPMIRGGDGVLVPASWPAALKAAAEGLRAASGVGVLPGGRLTLEDALAYSKIARAVLGTDDIDFRARPSSAEEAAFLAAHVAGTGVGPTFADIEAAPAVLLVALEAEEESPVTFLRLRKASMKRGLKVWSLAPFSTPGLAKTRGTLIPTAPGAEAATLSALDAEAKAALAQPGALILVGERLATSAGGFAAVAALAAETRARIAWIPRRSGERAALEAGLLPGLLPLGAPVTDTDSRSHLEETWGAMVPQELGRDLPAIIEAAGSGGIGALLVGGVELADLPDPKAAEAAFKKAFVVSLELRPSSVTELADVVFPVAAVAEKSGTFVNWEGRERPFAKTLIRDDAVSDHKVLDMLAGEFAFQLRCGTDAEISVERARLQAFSGERTPVVPTAVEAVDKPEGAVVLATWHHLLDAGVMQDREDNLAGTARRSLARVSPKTAAELDANTGDSLTITGDRGSVTLPLEVTAMPDGVVWVPTNARDCQVRTGLASGAGAHVTLSATPASPVSEGASA